MKYFLSLFISIACFCQLSGQWTEVTPIPDNFVSHHSFAFSLNDYGYIMTGGMPQGQESAAVYKFDPTDDSWSRLEDFPGGKRGYAIGDTWNGKAYFGFGSSYNSDLNIYVDFDDLWEFNPEDNTWRELAQCPCEPRFHPAFVAINDKIYVGMGGGEMGNLNDWWEYDMATDTWEQKADFPSHKRHHPYQFGIGQYIYAGFGHGSVDPDIYRQWYRFDPATNTWSQMADIPGEGRVAGTQFSHKGYGYVLSGDGDDHASMETGEFWKYDPSSNTWEELPPHPGESRWAPASFIINDEVYIMNGIGGDDGYDVKVYKYNLNGQVSNTSDLVTDASLNIYPNPASISIQINIDDMVKEDRFQSLIIYDLLGNRIWSSSSLVRQIDISRLESGTYLLEANYDDRQLHKKFVKLSE